MKYWMTSITAIDPYSNKLSEYEGPTIEANDFNNAEQVCRIKFPYATVIGQIIVKACIKDGEIKNLVDYENLEMN